jgi:SAM-dependent methyltransferase
MSAIAPAFATRLNVWPMPALLAWVGAWVVWWLALRAQFPMPVALMLGMLTGATLAHRAQGFVRRVIVAGGFPLSALLLGFASSLPAWAWLLLLAPLLAFYPARAWRDAPFFPTPANALAGLPAVVGTPWSVLDVGSGLGHGLHALRRLWPQATVHGVEWSRLLVLLTRCTVRNVSVQRADMWATSWGGHDLVYVFQRPESMARVYAKAQAELAPGAWLVSLEFAVPGVAVYEVLRKPGQKPVWVYQPAGPKKGSAARWPAISGAAPSQLLQPPRR